MKRIMRGLKAFGEDGKLAVQAAEDRNASCLLFVEAGYRI
jgi:hypothetical protein